MAAAGEWLLDPDDRRDAHLAAEVRAAPQRDSPLPRPEELRGYFDISADVGERILAMAEKPAAHRHELQRKTMRALPPF